MIIAIAGNPNCGKSTIFNLLTGGRQRVGNWPGVTVDKKMGEIKHKMLNATLVDLPGTYDLGTWSQDERVARDYLFSGEPQFLINVIDSTNIERNLYLTTILQERGIKTLVVLNMIDVAKKNGISINAEQLEKELGTPVIAVSALQAGCKNKIMSKIAEALSQEQKPTLPPPPVIENEEDKDEIIAEWRYKRIEDIVAKSVAKGISPYKASDRIDTFIMGKYTGLPIFLFAMYLLFWLAVHVGGVFIDFFDIVFGAIFVDGARYILTSINVPESIVSILADGVGSGIQALSTFFPIIFSLFFFMGLLENSGYIARAAFVVDRIMRAMGLPGKAFIPMLMGFGCSVPAIMATRSLENKRDKILSVFMVPFMSCGARLPVYIVITSAFFSHYAQNMIFALYIIGILLAIATGLLLKGTVYKGHLAPFVMELPQYHRPKIGAAAQNAFFRIKAFIKKASRILIPIMAILGVLNSVSITGEFGVSKEDSVLSTAGKIVTPVFLPMGISENNWQASVSLFSGLFAKESIVGVMNTLYSQDAAATKEETENEFSITEKFKEAVASIADNIKELGKKITNPLSLGEPEIVAESASMFEQMKKAFNNSSATAFAFLIFVLLYVPCVSAVSVAMKEVGFALVALQSLYSTMLGWCLAVIVYQAAEGHSLPFIAMAALIMLATVFGVILYAKKSGRFEGGMA
ncbi:MAG: ferrous iron transport protein B [Fibromonadaceae bacterium]|jgi:ferrous iron transport protein B|nr:ferrous iron transport protein B [Fibromonadaceae bacterium]